MNTLEQVPLEVRPEQWHSSRAIWVNIPDDEQLDPKIIFTPERLKTLADRTRHVIEKFLSFKNFTVLNEQDLLKLLELLTPQWIDRLASRTLEQPSTGAPTSPSTRLQRYLPKDRLSVIEAGTFSEKEAARARASDPFQVELLHPEAKKLFELFTHDVVTKRFVTLSSSHRVTGSLFDALSQAELYTFQQAEHTSIFQVDRHSDLVNMRGPVSLTKASVMRHLLQERLVSAIGCIGVEDPHLELIDRSIQEKVTSLSKNDLFNQRTRLQSKVLYQEKTDALFSDWKQKGIRSIYPSIDVDGLRLDDLGLTAVDYSQERLQLIALTCLGGDVYSQLETGRYAPRTDKDVKRWMDTLLRSFDPYQGIPTPWVAEALERARDTHGFEIGVTLTSGQRVAGDIVEFMGPDHRDHTAKLIGALTDRLLQISSKPPKVSD